ncbi:hypothetical protein [Streptomyces sp. NPDC048663]|uniref:hypothetical protein n=1 Tax=Streptomyces sp. NPDC048663 TaxID=3155638 RepID=UPI00341B071A
MSALTEADFAAARAQGDLTALVLMAAGLPVAEAAPKQRARTPLPVPARPRPGAWPDGARRARLSPEVAAYLNRLWPGLFGKGSTR